MRELDGGKLSTGHNVKIGYLSQHAEELSSGTARTVLEAAQHATGLTPGKARALLGRFLFSGEEAEKPLDGLSGGERRRLSLAVLVQSGANVLILDEPTNHLDLESREALEQALGEFPGSLLLVSHDRALLDAVGTRTVAFEDRKLRQLRRRLAGVPAGAWRSAGARKAAAKPARRKATPAPKPKRKPERERVTSPREQVRLEQEIEAAEAALRAVEDELADPAAWATPESTARSTERHDAAKRAVEELYSRWEKVAG